MSELATIPKQHFTLEGSLLSFSVAEGACMPLTVLRAVSSLLETFSIIAPPIAISLTVSGFETLVQVWLCPHLCFMSVRNTFLKLTA